MLKRPPEYVRDDERGRLTQVATFTNQLNILEINEGRNMGGHFHKETTEAFFILDGHISLWSYKRGDKEAIENEFFKNDIFFIEPWEWHAIEALSNSRLAVLLSKPYNPDKPDIHDGGLDGTS